MVTREETGCGDWSRRQRYQVRWSRRRQNPRAVGWLRIDLSTREPEEIEFIAHNAKTEIGPVRNYVNPYVGCARGDRLFFRRS